MEQTVQSVYMLCMGTRSLHALVQTDEVRARVGRRQDSLIEPSSPEDPFWDICCLVGGEVCSGIKECVHR